MNTEASHPIDNVTDQILVIDARLAELNRLVNAVLKLRIDRPAIKVKASSLVEQWKKQADIDAVEPLITWAGGGEGQPFTVNGTIETPTGPIVFAIPMGPLLTQLLGPVAILETLMKPMTNGEVQEQLRKSVEREGYEAEIAQLITRRGVLEPVPDLGPEDFEIGRAYAHGHRNGSR